MNISMDEIIKTFKEWERIVFDNVESFEKDFCHDEELIDVYWSSTSMKVYFIMINGQHVTDGYSMDEWFEWLRKNKN